MEALKALKTAVNQIESELLMLQEFESSNTIEREVDLQQLEKPYLYDTDLTAGQRVLLGIIIDKYEKGFIGCKQSSLVKVSGFSNKGVRQMMEALAEIGYVKRGIKAGSWELA